MSEKVIRAYAKKRRKRLTVENVLFTIFLYTLLLCLCMAMLYPIWNTLAISLNEGVDAIRGGIGLWPRRFTMANYRTVFAFHSIQVGFWNSALRTLVGAVTQVIATSMLAYTISRREYVLAKFITVIFILTMYFDAGLIPGFMLIRRLGLIGTFAVYWVPGFVGAFNLIIVRTFIKEISESLIESAKLDGAGEFRIYWQIIMPLCKPVLAVVALFVAVGQWNAWFDVFLFNNAHPNLTTLQFELQRLLLNALHMAGGAGGQVGADLALLGTDLVTPVVIRATVTMVAATPILVVYPFLQRYFVTGLQVGGVKG